jgi:hypothetical protein
MPSADRGSVWIVDLTVPQIKLVRKLGDLTADELALVEEAVRRWLAL